MRDNIKAVIESVIRERLAGTTITEIRVVEDEDYEGDQILRVMIVFDSSKGMPESHKMSGLARHLRSKLDEADAFSHPIFRFISQSDAKKLTAAAA